MMTETLITVISGGTGTSGEQLVRTALAQFPEAHLKVEVVPGVRGRDELRAAVSRSAEVGGLIVHTLVDRPLRESLEALAAARGVVTLDAMGPLLGKLAGLLGTKPVGTPGLYRKLREDYFKRIEAIEFAVAHDDGRNPHELDWADVVLLGASRVGKTPLSMYLAMGGWKTANVALVPGISPPAELRKVDRRRIVGMIVDSEQLLAHRRRRQQDLGVSNLAGYSEARAVADEIEHARQLFRRCRYAVVNVTNKPIEESASEVLAAVRR